MQKRTELITNKDGSIYHLNLLPEDISENIIIVGDPGRVDMLSVLLHDVRVKKENREFKTVTGFYGSSEITIISSGIGTDNIDIVINELDALVNIDLMTGLPKEDLTSLNLIRLGTSGGLRKDVPAGSFVMTETAVGFDGLLHFYSGYDWVLDTLLADVLTEYMEWPDTLPYPYAVNAHKDLTDIFLSDNFLKGISISAPGFYGPQGRHLRLDPFDNELNKKLSEFNYRGRVICNYEMESSAIYGLAALLGHKAITFCSVIANRVTGEFIDDYKPLIMELGKNIIQMI
jgi:uridine phosphorylase